MRRRDVLKGLAASGVAASAFPRPSLAQNADKRTLRVIYGSSMSSIDPIWTTAAPTGDFGWQVWDQLVGVDSTYAPKPQMVEGWSVEDNGRTYIFKLRDGLKFHNGEPVRANDCVPSIRRWGVRDGTGQAVASLTDGMDVIDDRTFRVRLKKSFALLPDALAKSNTSMCFIMPEHLANIDPFKQIPEAIGSGPYRFLKDEWVPGAKLAFAKFDGYVPRNEPIDSLSGGKIANVDRMEWSFITDVSTAMAALQAGEQDYWTQPLPDMIPILTADSSLVVQPRTTTGTYYNLVMNHLQPPFNNPAIRQAVAMAVDQANYMQAATGGKQPTGFCHSYFMCDTRYSSDLGGDVLAVRSIDKAKAALQAAGYKGERVVFLGAGDPPVLGAITQVTYDILQRMGFNVDFVAVDFATMTQRRTNKDSVDKGGWSIFNSTYGGLGLLDPLENILLRGAGEQSWFGWPTDQKLEDLRDQWLATADPAEQLRLAHEIQIEAFKVLPYIPLGYTVQLNAWSKRLTGVVPAAGLALWNIGKSA